MAQALGLTIPQYMLQATELIQSRRGRS